MGRIGKHAYIDIDVNRILVKLNEIGYLDTDICKMIENLPSDANGKTYLVDKLCALQSPKMLHEMLPNNFKNYNLLTRKILRKALIRFVSYNDDSLIDDLDLFQFEGNDIYNFINEYISDIRLMKYSRVLNFGKIIANLLNKQPRMRKEKIVILLPEVLLFLEVSKPKDIDKIVEGCYKLRHNGPFYNASSRISSSSLHKTFILLFSKFKKDCPVLIRGMCEAEEILFKKFNTFIDIESLQRLIYRNPTLINIIDSKTLNEKDFLINLFNSDTWGNRLKFSINTTIFLFKNVRPENFTIEILTKMLTNRIECFKYLDKSLVTKELCYNLIKDNVSYINYIPSELIDREILDYVLSRSDNRTVATTLEPVIPTLERKGITLSRKEINILLKNDMRNLNYVDANLIDNETLVEILIENPSYLSLLINQDYEVIKQVISKQNRPDILFFVRNENFTRELVSFIVKLFGVKVYPYLPYKLPKESKFELDLLGISLNNYIAEEN